MSHALERKTPYHAVFSAPWWKAAGVRAGRTAVIVASTYLPAAYTEAVPWLVLLSAGLVAGLLSILTSLAGLAEVNSVSVPWFVAIFIRVVKTVAQALGAGVLANVVFIQDINWEAVLATTIASGFGSLLLGVLKTLPETQDPVAQAVVPVVIRDSETGEPVTAAATTVNVFQAGDTTAEGIEAGAVDIKNPGDHTHD
jgi:hypothetical protein